MKRIILLAAIISCLTGCGHQARCLADKQFKDSVAMADGNKALGDFRFGSSFDEFMEAYLDLPIPATVYGITMWEVTPHFTLDDRLCSVCYVSKNLVEMSDENPFTEFATKKFGQPTIGKDIWVVGDRRITLSHKMILRDHYSGAFVPNVNLKEDREKYEYYMMTISSDSLSRIEEQQVNERWDSDNEQNRQKLQEQKEKDLQTL